MFDRFKSLKSKEKELSIFPNLKDRNELNLNENNNIKIQEQFLSGDLGLNSENLSRILSNEIIIKQMANIIVNNNRFIEKLTISIETSILKNLELKYDLTPTDKLKKFIEDNSNELNRINTALEDKTIKLAIVENKIAEALQSIAPQVNKMLTDVAQSILHNIGTN